MRKLREVLRLSYSAGLSIRKISASTKISVGSIQNILKLAEQLQITWPLPEDWNDQTLALKFYPRSDAQPSAKFQEPVADAILDRLMHNAHRMNLQGENMRKKMNSLTQVEHLE